MKILVPHQLTAADAYWHACTDTPVELFSFPLRVDRDAPPGNVYFVSTSAPRGAEWIKKRFLTP